jgi:L-2-hydroxyglutarate oxidase LhgO
MEKVDFTVIGAGVVGLAIAEELSELGGKSVVLVERNARYGAETSSRNSEVIHSGIYYPPGSLKAGLCVEGNRMLYELCEKHGIPHKKTRKLIVALDEMEFQGLQKLKENGQRNGLKRLELISGKKLSELEPAVTGFGALVCPETGIIDSEKLMRYFYNRAVSAGAMVLFNSSVTAVSSTGNGYIITIEKDNYSFETGIVINSAGLNSDKVAEMAGLDIGKLGYKIKFCKGEYFKIRRKIDMSHLIYPVPDAVSLGIHLVIDLAGGKKLGPNAIYTDSISYEIDENHKKAMHDDAVRYMPDIRLEDLVPDTCGIRPKLQGEKEGFRDFIIKDESENGLQGFINLIGIESPGLTSSPAIAKHVSGIIGNL